MQLDSIKAAFLMLTRPWLWTVHPLREKDLDPDPIRQFTRWYRRARRSLRLEFPNAMFLATVSPEGRPEGRMVLLKGFDEHGFIFYTNTLSVKGAALAAHPRAALAFYWEPFQRQVRIEGDVAPVSAAEADAYFATRPRGSQIGAWASLQSSPLEKRAQLEDRGRRFRADFQGRPVPRPPHWSGYRVIPERIEFWQLRASRLHDRFLYARNEEGGWTACRLYP